VSHPDVDLVSFIGGLVTGKRVAAAAAATVKKVALELGGKNPNVIFADARFDAAVDNALNPAFVNSGQVCSAGARLIVAEELHDRFVDETIRRARNIRLGGPFDDKAQTGPLIAPPSRTAEPQSPNHVRPVQRGPRLSGADDLGPRCLPERLTRVIAVPTRRRTQLVEDRPLAGLVRPLVPRRDRLGHRVPLAHRKSHSPGLTNPGNRTRQARRTRAFPDESTTPVHPRIFDESTRQLAQRADGDVVRGAERVGGPRTRPAEPSLQGAGW